MPLLPSTESVSTQQITTATQAILTSPTAAAIPTHPSQPVVAASYCDLQDCSQYTYPGDWANGVYGGAEGVMLVLPGQIWTGSDFVGIQQWDPKTGKLVKTIPDTVENDFADIKYDGKQVWAYALVLQQASADSLDTPGFCMSSIQFKGNWLKKSKFQIMQMIKMMMRLISHKSAFLQVKYGSRIGS